MRRPLLYGLLSSAAGAALCLASVTPAAARPAVVSPAGPVTTIPANAPHLNPDGTVEQVRQLVQCGTTMYAVGIFSSIKHNSTVYPRTNVFSFSAVAPWTVTAWAPSVNGIVNSIAFDGTDCSHAYIGGKFTSVNGTTVANLAELDTTTRTDGTRFAPT